MAHTLPVIEHPRRPDIPDGIGFVVVTDHGDTMDVEFVGWDPVLIVNRWTIPAHGVRHAVATCPCFDHTVDVVNGLIHELACEYGVTTLDLAANQAGPIENEVRDQRAVIFAEEV